ncbi:MAG: hypothetical protein IH618_16055 [Ignavibacteriaceae bacterium]|nr:hypothetical protein [Ignavibacteriaceae bacterium]
MIKGIKQLKGLPPYGPMAISFPKEWGKKGQEGMVVEFQTDKETWVGNFRQGLGKVDLVQFHPNKSNAIVIAAGDLWLVDADQHTAENILSWINQAIEVNNPEGWIFSLQDLAFARFGLKGIIWRTKRLSWDGFKDVCIENNNLVGYAWDLSQWCFFEVDLATGNSMGGVYYDEDPEVLERLHKEALEKLNKKRE